VLSAVASESAEYLDRAFGSELDIGALADRLAGCRALRGQPQHGDLWAANFIAPEGGWVILDFESFADVMVPLYDVFHMLRTHHEMDGERVWIDGLALGSAVAFESRPRIARYASLAELLPEEVMACFIFYSLHLAATTHADPGRDEFAAIRNLRRIVELEGQGSLTRSLLLGDDVP